MEWDLHTDAVTYAYNVQVHSVTSLTLFELVSSRASPLAAIEPYHTLDGELSQRLHWDKWKLWLKAMVPAMRKAMNKAQERLRHEFDAQVFQYIPQIRKDDYDLLMKQYCSPENEKRHTLCRIAYEPYCVVSINEPGSTVVCNATASMNAFRVTASRQRRSHCWARSHRPYRMLQSLEAHFRLVWIPIRSPLSCPTTNGNSQTSPCRYSDPRLSQPRHYPSLGLFHLRKSSLLPLHLRNGRWHR